LPELRIVGADKFGAVAKALREAPKDLRRESYVAMARAVKPLTQAVKDATATYMPSAYGAEVARTIRVRTRRRGGMNAGITLVGTAKTKSGKVREFVRLNEGRLRHPLFGNRGFWYDQRIKPGFWDQPLEQNAEAVRKELLRVLEDIARRIEKAG